MPGSSRSRNLSATYRLVGSQTGNHREVTAESSSAPAFRAGRSAGVGEPGTHEFHGVNRHEARRGQIAVDVVL